MLMLIIMLYGCQRLAVATGPEYAHLVSDMHTSGNAVADRGCIYVYILQSNLFCMRMQTLPLHQ